MKRRVIYFLASKESPDLVKKGSLRISEDELGAVYVVNAI